MTEYEFKGDAVLTCIPHPGARQEQRTVGIRVTPAHPDSKKEYALLLPNQTGCILSPKAAQALLGGRTVWIKVERVYQVALRRSEAQEAAEKLEGAGAGVSAGRGVVR